MQRFFRKSPFHRYEVLAGTEDFDRGTQTEDKGSIGNRSKRRWAIWSATSVFLTLVGVAAFIIVSEELRNRAMIALGFPSKGSTSSDTCTDPPLRREWRQLNTSEKMDYINAVKCLQMRPSTLNSNDTLYDDFPRVHQVVGNFAHDAATFLSWHRYFIQIYERTLRESCGYQGYLTYWDWALDYENPAKSPVFDRELGFGGNGDLKSPKSVGNGHCVTDGPFAGLQGKYFDDVVNNPQDELVLHCLSRGFRDGNSFSGHKFRPEAMSKLFRQISFDKFFLYLEHGPHNGIPQGIRGDFQTFTAPYDPLFFLHHTQVDRLWWLWQQAEPSSRMTAYSGRRNGTRSGANETASLDDLLPYHGLGTNILVSQIMSTRTDILCYQY